MKKLVTVVLISCATLTSCSSDTAKITSLNSCAYDRKSLLELSEIDFDQNSEGGWRSVADQPGCSLEAADLIRDYRQSHERGVDLYWHEAQLRAFAGQYEPAIMLMKKAYKPEESDRAGWNPYVEASIAFLRKDLPALETARSKLASVKPPVGNDISPVIDGFMEVDMADGSKQKIQWPPNISVVDGLVSCFGKSYEVAYECRSSPK